MNALGSEGLQKRKAAELHKTKLCATHFHSRHIYPCGARRASVVRAKMR